MDDQIFETRVKAQNPYSEGQMFFDRMDFYPRGFTQSELEDTYYNLIRDAGDYGLMLEAAGFEEVDEYYNPGAEEVDPAFVFEAVVVKKFSRLEGVVRRGLVRAMNKHMTAKDSTGAPITAMDPIVGKPRKSGLFAYVTVQIPFSDGQVVSIIFHAPEGDQKKIGPDDSVTAFRWLLNKRDITAVVAPEDGKEISLETVSKRVGQLVEKNTARFAATQKEAVEEQRQLEEQQTQIKTNEDSVAELMAQIEALQKELETVTAQAGNTSALWEKQKAINAELRARLEALQKAQKPATTSDTTGGGATTGATGGGDIGAGAVSGSDDGADSGLQKKKQEGKIDYKQEAKFNTLAREVRLQDDLNKIFKMTKDAFNYYQGAGYEGIHHNAKDMIEYLKHKFEGRHIYGTNRRVFPYYPSDLVEEFDSIHLSSKEYENWGEAEADLAKIEKGLKIFKKLDTDFREIKNLDPRYIESLYWEDAFKMAKDAVNASPMSNRQKFETAKRIVIESIARYSFNAEKYPEIKNKIEKTKSIEELENLLKEVFSDANNLTSRYKDKFRDRLPSFTKPGLMTPFELKQALEALKTGNVDYSDTEKMHLMLNNIVKSLVETGSYQGNKETLRDAFLKTISSFSLKFNYKDSAYNISEELKSKALDLKNDIDNTRNKIVVLSLNDTEDINYLLDDIQRVKNKLEELNQAAEAANVQPPQPASATAFVQDLNDILAGKYDNDRTKIVAILRAALEATNNGQGEYHDLIEQASNYLSNALKRRAAEAA